ncbi:MAG: hypothetical protein Q7T01_01535 [bacterium]|nr:hypothetical protein [bacterium]
MRHSSLQFVHFLAGEALPVLLVLYPLLLLLDDLEPGFVRSVVNPHAFLLALIGVAMLAPKSAQPSVPSRMVVCWGIVAALAAGAWVWWQLGFGTLGAVMALLTTVAVASLALALRHDIS